MSGVDDQLRQAEERRAELLAALREANAEIVRLRKLRRLEPGDDWRRRWRVIHGGLAG